MSETDYQAKFLVEKQMRKDASDQTAALNQRIEALRLELAGAYRVAEAARAFVKVTAGMEETEEGAALLEAVRQMEKMND